MSEAEVAVRLAYGRNGLTVAFPRDKTTVVEPKYVSGVADPMAELRRALREPVTGRPLRELVRPGQKVAVSICDSTRPQPRHLMIPALLAELDGIVPPEDVVLLVATGTHRANTDAEVRAMLGDDLVERVEIVNHVARDESSLTWCGEHGDGVPVWLNRRWVEADVKITTGFVEPHFFAGFSGGPKLVAPGLAGLQTVLTLHDARRIGDPNARWGVCVGNPVHDDVRAIAAGTGVDLAFDVILNRDHDIVRAFAGPVEQMHETARTAVRTVAMQPVEQLFDVVVTTNSGYPLDQSLYQAVKGMSAAAEVVKPGGTIICAAECEDGFPDHGSFRSILAGTDSPQQLLDDIAGRKTTIDDQWQVQVQARIQANAEVLVHSGYLDADDLRSAHLQPCDDIAATVRERLAAAGPDARVCVLPEGPQTIPYLQESSLEWSA